jgi:predicted nuclease of predicted toxin-antitoxin system
MPDLAPPENLFVRLYLDRHIKKQLAIDLRERRFDVVTTENAVLDTASDEEQLAFAANENRTILSFNIRDFAPLHERWPAGERLHGGIIVSQQLGSRQYGMLLARMLRLLDQFSADQMRNNLVHLEQFK